jgi:hypothetical protein
VVGAADPTEEAPGALFVSSAGATDGLIVEVAGVFEFKGSIATNNTPVAMRLRAELHELRKSRQLAMEKARLLEVLGTSPKGL